MISGSDDCAISSGLPKFSGLLGRLPGCLRAVNKVPMTQEAPHGPSQSPVKAKELEAQQLLCSGPRNLPHERHFADAGDSHHLAVCGANSISVSLIQNYAVYDSSQRSVLIEDESVLAFQTFIQFHGESADRKVA